MTPRRLRTATQAAAIRAGITLARQHMTRWPGVEYNLDRSGLDLRARLFTRAYLRTKLRLATTLRARRASDALQPLRRWLEHRLAVDGVPVDQRPTATTDLHRWGGCSIEYRDSHDTRRVYFFVTTEAYDFVDRYLPRGPIGEYPPDGWTPAVDRTPKDAARRQLS